MISYEGTDIIEFAIRALQNDRTEHKQVPVCESQHCFIETEKVPALHF